MNRHFVKFLLVFSGMFLLNCLMIAGDYPLQIAINPHTGAICSIKVEGDRDSMDWLVQTDGSQYSWIGEEYGWGLGYFTMTRGHETVKYQWRKPESMDSSGYGVVYREGDILIRVQRTLEGNDWKERYTFTNESDVITTLSDLSIYIPFNDNYPDAEQCIHTRAHLHIWDGGSAAYVNALRMGAYAPHLGLVVTDGAIKSYEIWERGIKKDNSQTRGIVALNAPDILLHPGQSYSLEWYLFSHKGKDDFREQLLKRKSVWVSCNRYVFQKGDTARVEFHSQYPLEQCVVQMNGVPIPMYRDKDRYIAEVPMMQAGSVRFDFLYEDGKQTHADCLVYNEIEQLIRKRVDFIRTRQQMNNPADLRNGAYMVYDNEGDRIYLNDTPNCNPVDRDEGAERTGMGILLAKYYQLTKDPEVKSSLLRYARFFRDKLQTEDYRTYSSVDQQGRNRGYNYAWASEFYFQMYRVTGDKQYVVHGYQTLQSLYSQFGNGFYCIGIPVLLGLQCLEEVGMTEEYKDLKEDFIRTGDIFVKNGLNYPKHEVNYEQSIVAPAIQFLTQLYLATGIQKYLDEVERQIPVLDAFNGSQPSYHLHDIAIRHWDGYWFGKREMFGDTFPHYWSTITGAVYHYYALCIGDTSYQERAEEIVRNNLCLFFEDGRASCAYLYPYRVDGLKAQFYDPYANDQDWALVYYLLINKGI